VPPEVGEKSRDGNEYFAVTPTFASIENAADDREGRVVVG